MRRARLLLLTGALVTGGFLALAAMQPRDGAVSEARAREASVGVKLADRSEATSSGNVHLVAATSELTASDPTGRNPDEVILPRWDGMCVGLDVLVDGRPLRTVQYQGRTYLPVPRWGTEYEIRVRNEGPRRILAIVSVDGLSVINGKPASEAQTGYIVAARNSILIKGWRRNLETVAAFSFEERDRSYASLIGRPENIGVIGLLAIEEMTWRPRLGLEKDNFAASAARGASGEVGGTGTGYGRDIDSPAYYVPFARSANKRTITFYYDTAEALRRAGVPVDGRLPVPFLGDAEFAPPPPGHRG
jgi:hypothetical protein